MMIEALRPGAIVTGPMLGEPVLTPAQLDQLTISPAREPFDRDPSHFRLGIEVLRLSLAYESEGAPPC